MSKIKCKVEDDVGHKCSNTMSKRQYAQDGMCERCAELLWGSYAKPLITDTKGKSIIFKDNYHGYTGN